MGVMHRSKKPLKAIIDFILEAMFKSGTSITAYIVGVILIAATLGVLEIISLYDSAHLYSLALLPIIIVSTLARRKPALFTAITSAVAIDYFYSQPVGEVFDSAASFLRLVYFCAVAELLLYLTGRIRDLLQASIVKAEEAINTNRQLDRILAVVAHDIRNPAANIIGLCDAINGQNLIHLATKVSGDISMIQIAAHDILTLVQDLVSHAAFSDGKLAISKSEIALRPFLELQRRKQVHAAQKKAINLFISECDPSLMIDGDQQRLDQALQNLIGNALKFSKLGTEVEISAKLFCDKIRISVRDHGPGIPATEIPLLFGSFQRLSNLPTNGESTTGLGLSIVKNIMDAHGVSIKVESTLGEGSTFFVDFSPSVAHFEKQCATNSIVLNTQTIPPKERVSRLLRVLIVDDDNISSLILARLLSILCCDVTFAKDGRAALETLQTINCNLVFMDCEMPFMNGIEAAKAIRLMTDKCCQIPIIGLTAHTSEVKLRQCLESGMNKVLCKPIDRGVLETILNDYSMVSHEAKQNAL